MWHKQGQIGRRKFLRGMLGAASAAAVAGPATAANRVPFEQADMRGSLDATSQGLLPGAVDDQSRILQAVLDRAAAADKPVFLPPGTYMVSNIRLPARTRITGVPGASRIVYTGDGHFILAEDAEHVELTGLVFDGANRALAEYSEAALRLSSVGHLVIDNCQVTGSAATGIQVDRSSGRIERSRISGATGECAIYAVENTGFAIRDNVVEHCANGGILVHRWQAGEDGTLVTGNRIAHIGAANGGTGPWGNGINVFRAHSVNVSNNQISDCAFSAIRSNGGSNVQILGNQCLRSGETAIYSEFEFEGAVIANNIVDGAAVGVSIANFMQGGRIAVCSNNLIRNLRDQVPYETEDFTFGTGISVEADTAVTGNVIEGAERYGMSLGWGPYLRDVVASSNVIRQAPTGIAVSVVEGSGNAVISDNVISGARDGAIVGYRWHDAVTGDLAIGGSGRYEHLAIERNRIG